MCLTCVESNAGLLGASKGDAQAQYMAWAKLIPSRPSTLDGRIVLLIAVAKILANGGAEL